MVSEEEMALSALAIAGEKYCASEQIERKHGETLGPTGKTR
jgi:hypothetical protein